MKDAATSNTESTIDAMKKRYIQLALVEAVGGSSAKQDHEPEDSKTRNDGGEADRDGERPRVAAATDQYAIYERGKNRSSLSGSREPPIPSAVFGHGDDQPRDDQDSEVHRRAPGPRRRLPLNQRSRLARLVSLTASPPLLQRQRWAGHSARIRSEAEAVTWVDERP